MEQIADSKSGKNLPELSPSRGETRQRREQGAGQSLVGELWLLLRATGKWWLVPVLLALLLMAAVVLLAGTSYAPLIYTLF
jgi:hypothetical protein